MVLYSVDKIMVEARKLAAEFRKTTGKTLGISGEIARFDAARLMGLELTDQSDAGGFDAIGKEGTYIGKRIQIKANTATKEVRSGQRVGQLKVDQEWDSVMLVVMNEEYEPVEIFEVQRNDLLENLKKTGTSKRSKRGAMTVAKFKIIGKLVWTCYEGKIED